VRRSTVKGAGPKPGVLLFALSVHAHLFRKDDSKASEAIDAAPQGFGRAKNDVRAVIWGPRGA
jgi:hypothetical protein